MALVTDIRIDASLPRSRKYRRTKEILGSGTMEYLINLWTTVALQRPSGVLHDWDAFDVKDAAGFPGDAEEFMSTMTGLKTRWIDMDDDGEMKIHDWEEHQQWVVKAEERSAKARNAAVARHSTVGSTQRSGNTVARGTDASSGDKVVLGKVATGGDLKTRLLKLHEQHFLITNPVVPGVISKWVDAGVSFQAVEAIYQRTAESKRATRWKWICEEVDKVINPKEQKPAKKGGMSDFLRGGEDEEGLGLHSGGEDDQGTGAIELVQDAGSGRFAQNG